MTNTEKLRDGRVATDTLDRLRKGLPITAEGDGGMNTPGYKPRGSSREGLEGLINALDMYEANDFNAYDNAMKALRRVSYNLVDIEAFSRHVPKYINLYHGMFLSAAINKVIGRDDTVSLTLDRELTNLGYLLRKGTVKIVGNCGFGAGERMSGGELRITGNVEARCGDGMTGGTITIDGDAEHYLGIRMLDGRITLNGNVGGGTGLHSIGGEIYINNLSGVMLPDQVGAAVYLNGKLVR